MPERHRVWQSAEVGDKARARVGSSTLCRPSKMVVPVWLGEPGAQGGRGSIFLGVLVTLVNEQLRGPLQEGCRRLGVPAIPVLDPVIGALAAHLGRQSRGLPGQQHLLDNEYFARIDAMTFALNHDDGQSSWGIN